MTFGTVAALFKPSSSASGTRELLALHTSGGAWRALVMGYSSGNNLATLHNGANFCDSPTSSLDDDVWQLVVYRKATGSVTGRFSIYDHTADAWTHGNGSTTLADWTSPGASGTVRNSFESGSEFFWGRLAVAAMWSNAVHWSADTTGDAAIEAAGLEVLLSNWVDESPDALWAFNQASAGTSVIDFVGSSDQTSITGTTVVTGDDPPGFTFDVDPPVPPITYKSQGAGAGTESNGASLDLVCPATVDANDILIAHVVKLDITTTPSTPADWSLLYGPADLGTGTAVGRAWVYGKLAVGDEDGDTIGFGTTGGTAGRFGRIYSFAGYSSGTLADVVPAASFSDTPSEDDPPGPSVTTTVEGALAVALIAQDDNNALADFGAVTGGTWSEPVAEFISTTIGAQGCVCQVQIATPTADPGTISGGTLTTATDEGSTIGFEIRPQAPVSGVTGTATGDFGFTGTAVGQPRTLGAAAGAFGFIGSAAGQPRTLGTATGDFGFEGNASGEVGTPPVTGTATGDFGFEGTAVGQPRTLGAATGDFGFEGNASGVPRHLGTATGGFGFTGSATGQPRTLGAAAGDFGFEGTAVGQPRTLGTATGDFGFEGNATGFVGTPPVTGIATGDFGFEGVASGQPRTLGTATGDFGFEGNVSGEVGHIGTAVGDFGFTGSAVGLRLVSGTATGIFGFEGNAAGGAIEPVPLPPLTATGTHERPFTTIGTHEHPLSASGTHNRALTATGRHP